MLKSELIKELDNKREVAKKNVKTGLFEAYHEGKATAYEEVIFMLKNSTLTEDSKRSIETYQGGLNDND